LDYSTINVNRKGWEIDVHQKRIITKFFENSSMSGPLNSLTSSLLTANARLQWVSDHLPGNCLIYIVSILTAQLLEFKMGKI
jgi:hypothetical protein